MSPTGINPSIFSLLQSTRSSSATQSLSATQARTKEPAAGDFSASLAQQMASFQMNSLTALFGAKPAASGLELLAGGNADPASGDLLSLLGQSSGVDPESSGLSASGRNLSLFDPESGYRMMSTINNLDVSFKAQFAELSAMRDSVAGMEEAGEALAVVDGAMDTGAIKARVTEFVGQYNAWIGRFDASTGRDGVLAGSWTARTAQHELEQSVTSIFNGAKDGFSGLRDLGLRIDQKSNLLTVDSAKLDAALASNKTGAVNTLDEFSANFAKSADLLNAADNVIPNQLANLDRAIDYIAEHQASLQQEFGRGDAASPAGYVKQALDAYHRMLVNA